MVPGTEGPGGAFGRSRIDHRGRHRSGSRTDCLAVSGGWTPVGAPDLPHGWARPGPGQPEIPVLRARRGPAFPGLSVAGRRGGMFSTKGCHGTGRGGAAWRRWRRWVFAQGAVEVPGAEDVFRIGWRRSGMCGPGGPGSICRNDVTVKGTCARGAGDLIASVEQHEGAITNSGHGARTEQDPERGGTGSALAEGQPARTIPEDRHEQHFAPPSDPVSIAADGGRAEGKGFAPERVSNTSHAAAVARGAPMIERALVPGELFSPHPERRSWKNGLRPGKCDMVRDRRWGHGCPSTLGKIRGARGPDAVAFTR